MIQKQKILRLLRSPQNKPMTRPELARKLGVSRDERDEFDRLLEHLEEEGEIIQVKGGRFCIPRELGLLVGTLEVNPRGFGFVRPRGEKGGDVYIHSEDMSTALDGDLVLVRLDRERHRQRGHPTRAGEVVRILKSGRQTIVGTLAQVGQLLCVIPDNPALIHDIYVDRSRSGAARPGQKVISRIVHWPSRDLNPEGEILEILGWAGMPAVDTLSVIREYNLRDEYPEAVTEEAKKIVHPITPGDRRGRKNLSQTIVFTVDPDDARDFDDAVSLEKTKDGNWLLGIHISDVSHYVQPATALDEEARARGTSVYFPARTLHMLPPALSTMQCSLRPQEEKLAQSLFVTFDPQGERRGYHFIPSVIKSRRRFTYGEVKKILAERDCRRDPELTVILREMSCLSQILRKRRFERGALDLELPEEKITFSPEGLIAAIELEGEDLAHNLIEEFMLAANETVADFLKRKQVAFIYRVHERPDNRSLREFAQFASAFGFQVKNPMNRKEIQSFLDSIKGTPLGYPLQTAFLRSLKPAQYSAENIGHFGLASSGYTYFTSPIRRYPDLHTHRILKQLLAGDGKLSSSGVGELALHCSEAERIAMGAEREVIRLRKLQFFQQQLMSGQNPVFEGVITGVKNFGLQVFLNRYLIGGLVPVSTLTDDFYRVDRNGTTLRGRRTKKQFRIGDVVKVQVDNVNMIKRQVDFILAE